MSRLRSINFIGCDFKGSLGGNALIKLLRVWTCTEGARGSF